MDVTSAEASHEKGIAVVQLSASVDDTVLKKTVEEEGYEDNRYPLRQENYGKDKAFDI